MSAKEFVPPRIIVNADDLGIHPSIDAGILSAHRNGILTSCTMLVTTPWLDQVVSVFVKPAALPIGLHLSLTLGKAVARRELVPDLVDANGDLHLSAAHLIRLSPRTETGRRLLPQIKCEFEAQLARARDCGLVATHADSHQHVHMNPAIFALVEDLLPRFGIHSIRFCCEPFLARAAMSDLPSLIARNNLPKWAVLRWCAARIRPRLATNDAFFGVLYSGIVNQRALKRIISWLPQGQTLEIGIHPGFPIPATDHPYPRPGYNRFIQSDARKIEHDVLCDPAIKELLRRRRIVAGIYGSHDRA